MWQKYRFEIALAALLLFFVMSRGTTLLSAGSLWFDEAFSLHVAQLPWHEAKELLRYEHNPWLPFSIMRAKMMFLGSSEAGLRLPSMIAGLSTLVLLVITGTRMFKSKKAGLLAGFFLSISTLHLYHQTEARMYAFLGLFASASLLCAWYWLQAQEPGRQRVWLLLYGLSTLALVHTHVTAWVFVIVLWVAVALEAAYAKRRIIGWNAANLLPLITGFIWLFPIAAYRFSQAGSVQGWFLDQHANGYFLGHVTNFLINGESRLPVRTVTSALATIALVSAFLNVERPTWWQKIKHVFDRSHWQLSVTVESSQPVRLLLIIFVGVLVSGFAAQATVTKYLLSASMPMFLLTGYGISRFKQLMPVFLLAFFLLALPTHLSLLEKRHHWDDVARRVEQLQDANKESLVVVHSFAYALPLRQYLAPGYDVVPFFPLDDAMPFGQAVARYNWQPIVNDSNVMRLDSLVAGHDTVALVSSTKGTIVGDPVKERLWHLGYKLVEQEQFSGYGDPSIFIFRR